MGTSTQDQSIDQIADLSIAYFKCGKFFGHIREIWKSEFNNNKFYYYSRALSKRILSMKRRRRPMRLATFAGRPLSFSRANSVFSASSTRKRLIIRLPFWLN